MKSNILYSLFFLLQTFAVLAQPAPSLVSALDSSMQRMLFAEEKAERISAFAVSDSLLAQLLATENSFDFNLDSLRALSVLYAEDRSFRIITAQGFEDEEHYMYLGYIQEQNGTYLQLLDKSMQMNNPKNLGLKPERWYGALYYQMLSLKAKGDNVSVLLFGYDAYSKFRRRKLIEVLQRKNGVWTFGAPIFNYEANPDIKRFMIEYASESKVGLKYDDNRQMILYDNLIPLNGVYKGQGVVMVPDGSYSAFKLQGDKLKWVEKVYNQVSTTPLDAGNN